MNFCGGEKFNTAKNNGLYANHTSSRSYGQFSVLVSMSVIHNVHSALEVISVSCTKDKINGSDFFIWLSLLHKLMSCIKGYYNKLKRKRNALLQTHLFHNFL